MNARLTSVLAAILIAAGARAQSPLDERASVTVTPSASPSGSGGSLRAEGTIGAFGFDHTVEGESGGEDPYLRITNPPLNGAFLFSQEKFERDGTPQEYDESFGPPVAHVTIGTGAITAGFDENGRLTVLGWPSPSYYDHVNYIHVTRGAPNHGAPENGGSFGGAGNEWLLPPAWRKVSQRYSSDDTETVETVLENQAGSVSVTITDVVHPTKDLVARNFHFSSPPAEGFAYYANMNPTTSRLPRAPSVTDGAADDLSDFATIYDEASSTMLHFRPYRVDPASPTRILTSQPDPLTALDAVNGTFGPGVYIAIGGQSDATEWQAGVDSWGLLRSEAEATPLLDPFYDLADGSLCGSPAAAGKTAGAIRIPPDDDGSFTIYIAADDDPSEAIALVREARDAGFGEVRAASEAWWQDWIGSARLPATSDAETLAVARRALMLIRTAQDRVTGAIVANATPQTPYRQDWVRDGAFFNYALLLAGYDDMALRHAEFYRNIYRAGGTWDTLYYADGAEAGLVFPYEIDSQAFALWALWLPYEFGAGDLAYLAEVYPAIRDTADAILLCRDPTNGMQCYAAEDDAVIPTQGAQGASTVYLALKVAAEAAALLDDEESRARWQARADEIRTAAVEALCDGTRCGTNRGGVYMVWPSRLLLDANAPLLGPHLAQYESALDGWSSFASPAIGGFLQYPMEPVFALSIPETRAAFATKLPAWIRWLAHDVVEPGVLHYGERIFYCDGETPCEPGRRYLHSIGFPHIWSGTEAYIAAAFVHGLTGPDCPAGLTIGEAVCVTGN